MECLNQQLQTEITLLVRELKERDRELNSMMLSHQQIQSSWSRDREGLLVLRGELSRAEERCLVADRELRNAQGLVVECQTSVETERTKRCELDRRVQEEQTRVRGLETSLETMREERDQLMTSLQSADCRIAELSSNEIEMKNAIQQTLEGAESLERNLEDKVSYLEELELIRSENEQLREQVNSSRDKILQLTNQLESSVREQERERDLSNQTTSKLQNSVSRLEEQLQLYKTAEERKSHLLASYRYKQERLEGEMSSLREMADRHISATCAPQLRADLLSPQQPTRDLSPSCHLSRLTDDPFPSPTSPVSPSFRRPRTLGIIPDEDETHFGVSQEVDRACVSLQLKLDTILHSIDTTQSPGQHRCLSVIPEDMELKLTSKDFVFD